MRNRKIKIGLGCGSSLIPAVFLVFLVLKLAEIGKVATWSWWWVTAPLWVPVAVVVVILMVLVVMYMMVNRK